MYYLVKQVMVVVSPVHWMVRVFCRSQDLNIRGRIFESTTSIDRAVADLCRELVGDDSSQFTAERSAKYLCDSIPHCYQVEVQVDAGCVVTYCGNQ